MVGKALEGGVNFRESVVPERIAWTMYFSDGEVEGWNSSLDKFVEEVARSRR